MHTFGETGTGVPAFLAKLWRLVEDPETNDLICWSKDGRSFIIQHQAQFSRELLPLNYKHNNMASFIRQLNMYGFHKITSIENGGLKFDRDEMEFSHPCFKRDCPYLLEHIKRKIANTKVIDEKAGVKPEAVNKVLTEVKAMRGRQDSLDSRFSVMKQENEALWREIATLRQKHMKQQQIVNKLIQFLVTIVQPSRNNMSGVKRHFQLMIDDAPQNAKTHKQSESDKGPVIHELTEELLEEVAEADECDLMNPVSSPTNASQIPERPRSNYSVHSQYDHSNLSVEDALEQNSTATINAVNAAGTPIVYHVTEIHDPSEMEDSHVEYHEENVLATPLVKQELAKQQQNEQIPELRTRRRKLSPSAATYSASTSKMMKNEYPQPLHIKTENDVDPMAFLRMSPIVDEQNAEIPLAYNVTIDPEMLSENINNNNNTQTMTNMQTDDFITNEMPSDLFEDNSQMTDINLATGSYNDKFDFKPKPSSSGLTTPKASGSSVNTPSSSKSLTLAKYNNSKFVQDEDIMRLSTPGDVDNHLDIVQDDLDSLKDILRGEGYTLDANALLGSGTTPNRIYLSQPLDGDILAKLFGDSDILNPYGGLSLSTDNSQDNSRKGSELMTYQPYCGDLSDIFDVNSKNSENGDNGSKSPDPPSSVLNTPYHE